LRLKDAVGVQAMPGPGSKLDPVLQLTDLDGKVLAEGANGLLGFQHTRDGTYLLSLRDRDYRPDAAMSYRLHVGPIPIVTSYFPLGVPKGEAVGVTLRGVYLDTPLVFVRAETETKIPLNLTSPHGTVLGSPTVVVGEFPEVLSNAEQWTIPVPGTANGR